MSKYIKTIVSPDGEKIEWRMHERFDPEPVLAENPEMRGADAAKRDSNVKPTAPDDLRPEEKKLLDQIGDYLSDLREKVKRVTEVVVKYVCSIASKATDGESRIDEMESRIYALEQDARIKLEECKQEFADELKRLARDKANKEQTLRHFRLDNRLTKREASYPESRAFHIGLILLALLGESIVNVYFYAYASDFGFIGGWLSALIVSTGNIMVSILIGLVCLRYMHHVSIFKKIVAWLGFVIFVVLLAILHLGAGHYRELLLLDPESAHLRVIPETLANPFGITDLDSFVLVLVGIAISILVIRKGYTYDDAYPGYGKLWRDWESCTESWHKADNKFRKEGLAIIQEIRSRASDILKEIEDTQTELDSIRSDFRAYEDNVLTNVKAALDDGVAISALFRRGYNYVQEGGVGVLTEDANIMRKQLEEEYETGKFSSLLNEAKKMIDQYIQEFDEWRKQKTEKVKKCVEEAVSIYEGMVKEEHENTMRRDAKKHAEEEIKNLKFEQT